MTGKNIPRLLRLNAEEGYVLHCLDTECVPVCPRHMVAQSELRRKQEVSDQVLKEVLLFLKKGHQFDIYLTGAVETLTDFVALENIFQTLEDLFPDLSIFCPGFCSAPSDAPRTAAFAEKSDLLRFAANRSRAILVVEDLQIYKKLPYGQIMEAAHFLHSQKPTVFLIKEANKYAFQKEPTRLLGELFRGHGAHITTNIHESVQCLDFALTKKPADLEIFHSLSDGNSAPSNLVEIRQTIEKSSTGRVSILTRSINHVCPVCESIIQRAPIWIHEQK